MDPPSKLSGFCLVSFSYISRGNNSNCTGSAVSHDIQQSGVPHHRCSSCSPISFLFPGVIHYIVV